MAVEAQQIQIDENKYWVEQYEALLRLEKNEDFKKVILQGYLENNALRAVSLLARSDIKARGERPSVMEDLVAISSLHNYFLMLANLGGSASYDEDELENEGDK